MRGCGALGLWLTSAVVEFCFRLSLVVFDRIDQADGVVVMDAHPRVRGSRCCRCGRVSARMHNHYRLAELPVSGRQVVLRLTKRRFFLWSGQLQGLRFR